MSGAPLVDLFFYFKVKDCFTSLISFTNVGNQYLYIILVITLYN